ncbi:hypothetical protein CTEN210_10887 [Chaetoceros tenuissimus]|uniref:BTB domain-containing protein n=1 Tax=Chaetoceros tenuissimus TaxID=426638 RepID=A0AAD3D096_9STRA|nr:hypothetical protein CTEN210_10887 [Chaetoceros tenuissimus]
MVMQNSPRRIKPMSKVKHESFLYMQAPPTLSWRLDPQDSLSDWTLRVSSSDQNKIDKQSHADRDYDTKRSGPHLNLLTKTFFVHKTVLGVGPRRSEFFANLFKNKTGDSRDDVNKTVTKIELLPSAVAVFPVMLDYLYAAPGSPIEITTETAVALRHLASSFGIKEMFNETTSFIQSDMNVDTAVTYLCEGKKFKNEKIVENATRIIASKFKEVKLTHLSILSPKELLPIITSPDLRIKCSESFSSRIGAYCRCRQDDLTLSLLESFTHPTRMPMIAEPESLYFLHLYLDLGGMENSRPESLYTRCIVQAPKLLKQLRSRKTETNRSTNRLSLDLYSELPDRIKVQILERIEVQEAMPSKKDEEKPRNDIKRSDSIEKQKKKVVDLQNEMEKVKMTYEKKLDYLLSRLEKKEEELKQVVDKNQSKKDLSFQDHVVPTPLSKPRYCF